VTSIETISIGRAKMFKQKLAILCQVYVTVKNVRVSKYFKEMHSFIQKEHITLIKSDLNFLFYFRFPQKY